jgi:hypothetical protein
MADISCIIFHYPFTSSFCEKVEDAARTGRYGMLVTDEYRMYSKCLNGSSSINFNRETARRFSGLEQLVEDGFLIVSDDYRRWVQAHSRNDAHVPVN